MALYLRRHPFVSRDLLLMVRTLPATENGLPVQIYCFSSDKNWPSYESIQAEIMEHFVAVLPAFELYAFQRTGARDVLLNGIAASGKADLATMETAPCIRTLRKSREPEIPPVRDRKRVHPKKEIYFLSETVYRNHRQDMTRIAIKRVYEPATDTDGLRVLVDKLWPRGIRKEALHYDLWAKGDRTPPLPSGDGSMPTRKAVGEEFRRRYLHELAASPAVRAFVARIEGTARDASLRLQNAEENHRACYGSISNGSRDDISVAGKCGRSLCEQNFAARTGDAGDIHGDRPAHLRV